jgi:hypothetical protein
MQRPDEGITADDRRTHTRCSVYGFMHATATLSGAAAVEQGNPEEIARCCTGLLADISHEGAQLNMPGDCRKYLKENQKVIVRIKTTFTEKMDFDVPAQVRYIVGAGNTGGLQVGVKFADLQSHRAAETAIYKICEFGRKLKAVSAKQAEQTASADN